MEIFPGYGWKMGLEIIPFITLKSPETVYPADKKNVVNEKTQAVNIGNGWKSVKLALGSILGQISKIWEWCF